MEVILTGMPLSIFFNCLLSQLLPRDVVVPAWGVGKLQEAGEQEGGMSLLLVHPISGTHLTGKKAFRR